MSAWTEGPVIFQLNVAIILLATLGSSLGFKLFFGDCPLYFEEPCRADVVKFILFTTSQRDGGVRYRHLDPFRIRLPRDFNAFVPIKVVIHGYGGLATDSATRNVSRAYQDEGYNVIVVDWGYLSAIPCYTTAFLNTWHVGQCVGLLAASLVPLGIGPALIHVVGFSLGAHIAGFAGANVKNYFGTPFYRITGLDPALPFFATLNNDWKLDKDDASFVDIIHTSAGSFGKIEPMGHADFYVNGGMVQPVCYNRPNPPICSHLTVGNYFADSITSRKNFIGRKCENVFNYFMFGDCQVREFAVMGERCSTRTSGIFFVETEQRRLPALSNLTLLLSHNDNYYDVINIK